MGGEPYIHTCIHTYICTKVNTKTNQHVLQVQPIAFEVSFNLDLQSESPWSLYNATWQKRPRELEFRLRFEIEEIALQMQ